MGEFADGVKHAFSFFFKVHDAHGRCTIAEEFWRSSQEPLFPESGLRRMNLVLGTNLRDRFRFLDELEGNPAFEFGRVGFFE